MTHILSRTSFAPAAQLHFYNTARKIKMQYESYKVKTAKVAFGGFDYA
jgi:hypothetical protein